MDVFANHPVQQQTQNMILSQQQLQSLKMLELTAQELEQDAYIQALIESSHDVYIYASEDEGFLRIVIK